MQVTSATNKPVTFKKQTLTPKQSEKIKAKFYIKKSVAMASFAAVMLWLGINLSKRI